MVTVFFRLNNDTMSSPEEVLQEIRFLVDNSNIVDSWMFGYHKGYRWNLHVE